MTDQDHFRAIDDAAKALTLRISEANSNGLLCRFRVDEFSPHILTYQVARVSGGSISGKEIPIKSAPSRG